jgi:hypothetical protein
MQGWISSHRKILENPIVCKDTDHYAVWGYLLHNATHKEFDVLFKGKKITLKPGQLITGRKTIARFWNISESKVQRILKTFETEQQIEQQTTNKNRLITILNWELYQKTEQQIEQQVNNERTTSEQQVNTNNNINNINNENNVSNNNISKGDSYDESLALDINKFIFSLRDYFFKFRNLKVDEEFKRKGDWYYQLEELIERSLAEKGRVQTQKFFAGKSKKLEYASFWEFIINVESLQSKFFD